MPRVKGLGELDWDFENIGNFPFEYTEKPVKAKNHYLTGMILLLVSDKAFPNGTRQGEKALWNYRTGKWENVVDRNTRQALPAQVRQLFEMLFYNLEAVEIMYFWDGGRRISVKVGLADGIATGFAPPKYPVGQVIEITSYARFLDSIARKMSKWWKEIKQEENTVYLERVTAEALFVQATGFLPG